MQFYVVDGGSLVVNEDWALPAVVLQPMSWNDWWRWRTAFFATLVSEDGSLWDLGSVKIADLTLDYEEKLDGSGGVRTPLPSEFLRLPKRFASLGQDETYYLAMWKHLGKRKMRTVLASLRDLVIDQNRFNEELWTPTVSRSLTRSVPTRTVQRTFANILINGDPKRSFDFKFTRPSQNPLDQEHPVELDFAVEPGSTPPTNVHVLIGRNGSGKTTLLQSMTRVLLGRSISKPEDGNISSTSSANHGGIANLVYVAFSAFDEVDVPVYDSHKRWAVPYSFVGLQTLPPSVLQEIEQWEATDDIDVAAPVVANRAPRRNRRPSQLASEFARSAGKVLNKSPERWRSALLNLESDPNFRDAGVSRLASSKPRTGETVSADFERNAVALFNRLSSGHKIVLLTTTRLVETVSAETLVVLDEPEAHLHPPLLSAFTRALSDLMQHQNGLAIVATHSPVILQEVPMRSVWKVERTGHSQRVERPAIESFAENVGTLTNAVFGLEVRESGFHKMLLATAAESSSYDEVIEKYDGELGFEGRALLFSWFTRKQESD